MKIKTKMKVKIKINIKIKTRRWKNNFEKEYRETQNNASQIEI